MPIFGIVKKLLCMGLAMVMLIGTVSLLSLDSYAVSPTYQVSKEYKSSKYYAALEEYILTGDERYDVVSIALTQYGYHEGSSDEDMHGMNLDGYKNYAEYNRLYGKLNDGSGNGNSYGYSWCAMFVSWCLRQARVPDATMETFIACSDTVRKCRRLKMFKEASSGYTPIAGDIIFFNKPEYAAQGFFASHVGLVVGADEEYVYTIEGNTDYYSVCQKKYPRNSEKVVGYAVPNYKVYEGTNYNFPLRDDTRHPGKVLVSAETLKVCTGVCVYDNPLGELKAGDVVEVLLIDQGWGLIDYAGSQGWISMIHTKPSYAVTLDPNGGEGGTVTLQRSPGDDIGLISYVPERDGHVFLGWSDKKDGEILYLPDSVYTADADAELYAVWQINEYTVSFLDWDGREIFSGKYTHGTKIEIPENPQRESDGVYKYSFVAWDSVVSEYAFANCVYKALYSSELLPPDTTEEVTAERADDTTDTEEITTEEITPPESSAETTEGTADSTPTTSPVKDRGCGILSLSAVFTALTVGIWFCCKNKIKDN